MPVEIALNDIVRMRKRMRAEDTSGASFGLGADIGIKCLTCGRRVLLLAPNSSTNSRQSFRRQRIGNSEKASRLRCVVSRRQKLVVVEAGHAGR